MKILKILAVAVVTLLVLGTVAVLVMGTAVSPSVETGTAAPDVALTQLDGSPLPLASLRGKVVLLDFWGST